MSVVNLGFNKFFNRLKVLKEVELNDIISYKGNYELQDERLPLWIKSAQIRLKENKREVLIFFREVNADDDSYCHSMIINSSSSIIKHPSHSVDDHNITEEAALAISLRLLQEIQPYDLITKLDTYGKGIDYHLKPNNCQHLECIEISGTKEESDFERRTNKKLKRLIHSSDKQGFISISCFSEECSHRFVRVIQ